MEHSLLLLANEVLMQARAGGYRIITAESCTGGLITSYLTDIHGSSDVVVGGFVTYSNLQKQLALGVNPLTLVQYGAVSKEIALEMAMGALQGASHANIAIAVTGVAGPGQSEFKPQGLVHFALMVKDSKKTLSHQELFTGKDRHQVRLATVETAFKILQSQM